MKGTLFILLLSTFATSFQSEAQEFSFFERTDALLSKTVSGDAVRYDAIDQVQLNVLVQEIGNVDLEAFSEVERKAFLINAYNLLVIYGVRMAGDISSVQDVPAFFDAVKYKVAGKEHSLNQIEKDLLFKAFPDPRLHFVLVCGAKGCPPLHNAAFFPNTLDEQLDERTRYALGKSFVLEYKASEETLLWSAIFDWYSGDFGRNKEERIEWINQYRAKPIPTNSKTRVMPYDWSLNEAVVENQNTNIQEGEASEEIQNNSIRYVVSSTIPKGSTETKVFNNLYTQATRSEGEFTQRSNFFTSIISSLYGVSRRFNAGIELRYRRVSNEVIPSSPLDVFQSTGRMQARQVLATVGPKIRWAPVEKWGNFSVQSALWFPLRDDLEGNTSSIYTDWNKATSFTQIFNDFALGNAFSLFTEVDFLWEDIGREEADLNRMSTPVTVIASYFPEPKTTLYVLNGFSPFWKPELDYFYQSGMGAKYQFTRNFELELLYTWFTNSFLQENNGRAATFNFGIRINTQ